MKITGKTKKNCERNAMLVEPICWPLMCFKCLRVCVCVYDNSEWENKRIWRTCKQHVNKHQHNMHYFVGGFVLCLHTVSCMKFVRGYFCGQRQRLQQQQNSALYNANLDIGFIHYELNKYGNVCKNCGSQRCAHKLGQQFIETARSQPVYYSYMFQNWIRL